MSKKSKVAKTARFAEPAPFAKPTTVVRFSERPAPAADASLMKSYKRSAAYQAMGAPRPVAQQPSPFVLPSLPPGVVPNDAPTMAQDDAIADNFAWAVSSAFADGQVWLGYPVLAQLAQRPEYRRMSEQMAKEMTRKWISFHGKGDDDKTDKINAINEEMKRLKAQAAFRRAAELDGFFGRAQIYPDFGTGDDAVEMETPLFLSPKKIKKGSLRRLKVLEPIWTYPATYNASDPLADDFYRPQAWYVYGKKIHASRLLTLVGREMPDLLKPSYSFGGLSLTQMAKPYVDNWLRTRQSVSDLLHSFSVSGLKTSMESLMQAGGDEMIQRMEAFNKTRDNRGLMLLDKETEEFFNVATPLGTLDHLQAQSQEQMAAVCGIPLVVLLGITPSGLNASSDGEIRTFYAWIEAQQEQLFTEHLDRLSIIVQLNLFGEVDPDIHYRYEPLWQMDETELATRRKTNADTDAVYITNGVLDPAEVRQRIAEEDDSLYHGLDLSGPPPEPPEPPGNPEADGGEAPPGEAPVGEAPPNPKGPPAAGKSPSAADLAQHWVADAEGDFDENKIKRDAGGKFSSTGSGGSSKHDLVAKLVKPLGEGASLHAKQHHEYLTKALAKIQPQVDAAMKSADPKAALAAIKVPVKLSPVKQYLDKMAINAGSPAPTSVQPQSAPATPSGGNPPLDEQEKAQLKADGIKGHAKGMFPSHNPWDQGTEQYASWEAGWQQAEAEAASSMEDTPELTDITPPASPGPASDPSSEGTAAHASGKSYNDMPYEHGTPEANAWKAAWLDADDAKANEAPKAAASAPQIDIFDAMSSDTHSLLMGIKGNLDKVLPENKAPVTDMLNSLSEIIKNKDVDGLAKFAPIPNPTGMAQQKANEFLASLKADVGVSEVAAAKVEQAAKVLHAAPPKRIHNVAVFEDANGNEVEATLKANTKDIPGDHYAAASLVFNDKSKGPAGHEANAVMQGYYDKAIKPGLTSDHKSAISDYQDGDYDNMNKMVSGILKFDESYPSELYKKKALEKSIASLNDAIAKAPPVPADIPVYRGMKCSLKDLTGFADPTHAVDRCFEHKNFASVSRAIDKSKAFAGGSILLKFTIPAGTRAMVMPKQSWEKEILMGTNGVFKVDKVVNGEAHGVKHIVHCTYLGTKTG